MLLLCLLLIADANTENRLREALRSATTQLQSAQDESAQLQADKGKLQKELEATKAELAAAKRAPRPAPGLSAAAKKEYEEKLAAAAASQAQCSADLEAAQKSAQAKEAERAAIAGNLDAANAKVSACQAKNEKLFQAGQELIGWMKKNGVGGEPFLGLHKVKLENAAQDYEDKLLDQRLSTGK